MKLGSGRGVTPGIPFVVSCSLSWGRLEKWNRGPPTHLPPEGRGDLPADYDFLRTLRWALK